MMLKLYNSLSRTKDIFTPIDKDHVRVYACGPTVYNIAHIGNARMAVVFDTLVRLLKHLHPKVTYVSNLTDIDDKIMIAAKEQNVSIEDITTKYADIYNNDMSALGCALPDIQPRATETVPEMIEMMVQLIEHGHAYTMSGHVLFNVPSYEAYGALSGRSRDEQIAGARVEIAPYKKDAADFVLWKPSNADEPGWDSPWGRGRPGWHIECSAMSEKHLGLPFDIHGGGADLKFPHHENEIAQSCCAHGIKNDPTYFAKTWVHNGFVTVNGEKMSKSLGNTVYANDLLSQGVSGEAIRLALLSAHYRQPLDWSDQCLKQAQKALDKFYKYKQDGIDPSDPHPDFLAALSDDLNTPKAIAVLHDLTKQMDKAPEDKELIGQFLASTSLISILNEDTPKVTSSDLSVEEITEIEDLIAQRNQARADKDFVTSDRIRDQLASKGITIKDGPDGTNWEVS